MINSNHKIGVIGAGGWGTALSIILAENGRNVKLWAYEDHVVDEINKLHSNSMFLPGIVIPDSITATSDTDEINEADIFILTIPTQFIRQVFKKYQFKTDNKIVISGAKGIENNSLMRVSEILADCAGVNTDNFAIISGPSHAEEVARKTPTAVIAASENYSLSEAIQELFCSSYFRVYSSHDLIGAELGGALKNVIALAAGVIDGLKLGDNTKAALLTRGLAEMSRLGVSLGAEMSTFYGLSGLGDLSVTCNSKHSRNRFVGEQIGMGRLLGDIQSGMKMVAEGVSTTKAAYQLAKERKVEMPIVEKMHELLFDGLSPNQAIIDLMTRQNRHEWK